MGVSVGKGVDVVRGWVETGVRLPDVVPVPEEEHSNSAALMLEVISGLLLSYPLART